MTREEQFDFGDDRRRNFQKRQSERQSIDTAYDTLAQICVFTEQT